MTDQPDVTPIPKPEPKKKTPYRWPRRKRIKPMSDKRRDGIPERDEVRETVKRRDGDRCRLAPFFPDTPCGPGDKHPHHIQKASEGGKYVPENLWWACDLHNGMVEDDPKMAEAMGLVLRTDKSGRKPWPQQQEDE